MIHILVTGDTHGPSRALPDWLLSLAARADLILHTGDVCDLGTLSILMSMAPVLAVRGNNDHGLCLPESLRLRLEGVEVGMAHGHLGPGSTTRSRATNAVPGVRVVLFGHSHEPGIWQEGEQIVLNPGSPTQPRRSRPGAAWLDIGAAVAEVRLVGAEDA